MRTYRCEKTSRAQRGNPTPDKSSACEGYSGLECPQPLKAAMKLISLLSAIALLLLGTAAASQNPARPTPDTVEGKKVFAASGCAKCHDVDGSKRLADGTTLLGRLSKAKDPESRLGTRLKNPDDRRQVFLYLKPLIAAMDPR